MNRIIYSTLRNFYDKGVFTYTNIKYCFEGEERYTIGSREFRLAHRHFLLGSASQRSEALVDSKTDVLGIVIYIKEEIFRTAYALISSYEKPEIDDVKGERSPMPEFESHIEPPGNSMICRELLRLESQLTCGNLAIDFVHREWFLGMAETVICEQMPNLRTLNRLNRVRRSTKQEILRRLLLGKRYMEDNFHQQLTVKEIARVANMAEFHFFRSFRDAFGLTPMNHLRSLRMERAAYILSNAKLGVSEVATQVGYADTFSFSKAFKKYFGIPPGTLRSSTSLH